jgi:hypothetical protein
MTRQANLWKIAGLAIVVGMPLVAVAVDQLADRAATSSDGGTSSTTAAATSGASAPARVVGECNRLAAQAPRDTKRIFRDAFLGGAVGAGLGAAGGAIADGGDGAGKGAGIGALVGVTAGTLYGLNEENRKSESAVAAYRECMAHRGWY